ncbi:alanine--tRNA ligase [Hanamia caeni]|uniref:Alanine--tRNA ligase n=2 Tax=Hanamia caeni TaxID=2294116 RepID=A0A3M9NM80_9BACT|nr:alanine--tRNA ligase [Hanamia caeni]
MSSGEIRQHFLDFFKSKEHQIVASAPIVIKNDPTLLFTNAGMNQFKEYFLGNSPAPYSRVADTQKCLRVSGKHNDLEEVGVDTYHHTMFEMLGNWSFGNATKEPPPYFKEKAIDFAWELLTGVYKIPEADLYVSVFEGDEKEGLPRDEESLNFWKKNIDEDRIIFGNKKDNFWEMGDTGPCGPSTEIHVDCRSAEEKKLIAGKDLINKDNPQVIEIWNIVFIQYNRKKDGSLELLPAKHVDTGMGFERLVRVLQNKKSNYDTDIFSGTIEAIEKISGKKYDYSDSKEAISFRVIADHIRAIAFPIADGQLPSNIGAGYVIRRILRRAVRYYFSYLDVREPLLFKLVPLIAEQFKNVFPNLNEQKDFVAKVIHEEENSFLRTLDAGLKRLELLLQEEKNIDGKTAFELYDTYGFPIDLTRLIAAENNLAVDETGFEKEMQQQKNRSRAASVVDTEDWIAVNKNEGDGFVGYEKFETQSKILKYRKIKSKGKEVYQIVLDTTPFYAESGGQVGDTGQLIFDQESIPVINTKKENELILHFTEKLPRDISSGVVAKIDVEKRNKTAVHHSATHLMHAALRKVLGTHVQQKGSLVNEDYLRFDFSHFSKMTNEEIEKVESIVNKKIRKSIPVVIQQMPKEEALKTGAMALFGEKYGDLVRVVMMDPNFSIELCGGTHVGNTGELGYFKIINETAVGAGLRRIEAVSGKAAEDVINKELNELKSLKEQLKNPKDTIAALENLLTEREGLKKQVDQMELQILETVNKQIKANSVLINGVHFIGQVVLVSNAAALKKLASLVKENQENYLILLCADIEGKPNVVIAVDEKFISLKNTDAVKIIKEKVAPLIKGGGGGQKTMATAGGQDASGLEAVIQNVKSLL